MVIRRSVLSTVGFDHSAPGRFTGHPDEVSGRLWELVASAEQGACRQSACASVTTFRPVFAVSRPLSSGIEWTCEPSRQLDWPWDVETA